jgi:hypothetical protein
MMSEYTVGEVMPSGATVTSVRSEEHPDGSITETIEATHPSGAVDHHITTRSAALDVISRVDATLRAGLVNNVTWLMTDDPTTDHEQIQALTRQVNALIRQVLGLFDAATGT